MIDYKDYSDEKLIELYRGGDDNACDYLVGRHKALVRRIASQYYIPGAEPEDTVQEGMFGLFKAVRDFDPERGAKFSSFAVVCIRRQIMTAMTAAGREKNAPLNESIPLSLGWENEDGEASRELIEEYADKSTMNPEQVVIEKESLEDLQKKIWKDLSEFERKVYELQSQDKSYVEIAEELNIDLKSSDNAIQRIRKKTDKARKRK